MGTETVSISKDTSGSVTVSDGRYITVVDVRTKGPKEAIEAVRWAVLMSGHVYTEKIEKKVRKVLEI